MKKEARYQLEEPPKPEDLNPNENYLEEFDRWAQFRSAITFIASNNGMSREEAIEDEELYQQALDCLEVDDENNDNEDGLAVFT